MAGKITRIEEGRRGLIKLYIDGALALRLTPLVAAGAGLVLGRYLSDEDLVRLQSDNEFRSTLDAALNYLSFRARSSKEIRDYLNKREAPPEVAEAVMARLRELRLIDDASFAQKWVEERKRLSPRGSMALRQELRRKGIAAETVEESLPEDDPEEAYRLAVRRAAHLDRSDWQAFRRRLGSYLLRRGYSYEIVGPIVARLLDDDDITHEG